MFGGESSIFNRYTWEECEGKIHIQFETGEINGLANMDLSDSWANEKLKNNLNANLCRDGPYLCFSDEISRSRGSTVDADIPAKSRGDVNSLTVRGRGLLNVRLS